MDLVCESLLPLILCRRLEPIFEFLSFTAQSAALAIAERVQSANLIQSVLYGLRLLWWRVRMTAVDLAAVVSRLGTKHRFSHFLSHRITTDFATFRVAGRFWQRQSTLFADKLWARGSDSRLRRVRL